MLLNFALRYQECCTQHTQNVCESVHAKNSQTENGISICQVVKVSHVFTFHKIIRMLLEMIDELIAYLTICVVQKVGRLLQTLIIAHFIDILLMQTLLIL